MSTELKIKTQFYLLSLFVVFLSVPIYKNGTSLAIILLSVIVLVDAISKRKISFNRCFVFLLTPLIIYLLGMLNTENYDYGLSFLLRNISFILIPLIFSNLNLSKNHINIIKNIYIAGCFITGLYTLYYFLYYFNIGTKLYMIISLEVFHTTYIGLLFGIAFFISLWDFLKVKKISHALLPLCFLFFSIITSARIILISLIIILIFGSIFFLNKAIHKLIIISLIVSIGVLSVFYIPSINDKFNQIKKIESLKFDKNNYQSISSRLGKVEAAINVIKQNPFFGTGTGDLYEYLEVEYRKMEFTMGYKYNYNPHNQYLSFLTRNGLIGGGLIIISIYIYPFIYFLKKKDYLVISILSLLAIVSLTESILDVQKGLYIYIFFICIFYYKKNEKLKKAF